MLGLPIVGEEFLMVDPLDLEDAIHALCDGVVGGFVALGHTDAYVETHNIPLILQSKDFILLLIISRPYISVLGCFPVDVVTAFRYLFLPASEVYTIAHPSAG